MSLDAAEARRISAQLATLEQQRAQGRLPHEDTPLRLYRVRAGGFVRVLDQHAEPISQGMLDAIDAFIRKNEEIDDVEEAKVAVQEKREEQETDEKRRETVEMRAGDENQGKPLKEEKYAVVTTVKGGGEDAEMTVDDVEKTQKSESQVDVGIAPPWEAAMPVKTPQELLAQNERVSEWLDTGLDIAEEVTRVEQHEPLTTELNREPAKPVDHPTLYEQWPPQLEERRRMWFVPRGTSRKATLAVSQPVVYWMHNTLRVTQGNYGLEAAILLSRRLAAPLVVVCLVPSSIIYPVCHSTTASDAYARYSFVELYQQFSHAGVPFFGITAKEGGVLASPNEHQSITLKPNPVFELLDGFAPHAVVTDAIFDFSGRNDMVRLARYLELNRSSCSWSLISMDSTTCYPAYQLSMKLQSTFERGAAFASEEQFGAEYAPFAQPRNGTYVFSPLPRVSAPDPVEQQIRAEILSAVLQRLQMEQVNWQIVKAENSQARSQMRRFSEGEGLQKLSQLLSVADNQPAIQAELLGGGVLSLLPFIRHGSLFAGYVLHRITEAIASCPAPTTPQERKALAMRKVMRSRAVNHLGKERDYVLYLALWSSTADCGESRELHGPAQPDITSLSTSELMSSLRSSVPRTSSLDAYRKVLPGWTYSSARIGEDSSGKAAAAAVYDPYELESARTKDLYWNEIQKFLVEQQYLHPVLVVYWAYRVMTWSVSSRAAIATIESLVSQCALGAKNSPDAVFIVWKLLFRLGSSNSSTMRVSNGQRTPNVEDLREFQLLLEGELASQPKLQLRP